MLIEEIKKSIINSGYEIGEKLPSVRDLAKKVSISTGTVLKIYKELETEGLIKAYSGKGYFWGECKIAKILPAESIGNSLEALFAKDLESGYLNAFDKLPSIKELSIRYKISLYHIRNFLNLQASKGILKHIGNKFYFDAERPVKSKNYILFVHCCDKSGRFIIDSEREMEVFRVLAQFAADQKISIRFIGFHKESAKLLTPQGREFFPREDNLCLGAFLSTWFAGVPTPLFAHFAKFTLPISVWWEYAIKELPAYTKNKLKWAYFNLAFGPEVGVIVGKYLKRKGIKKVQFISPFHESDWSKMRLKGLSDTGLEVEPLVLSKMGCQNDIGEQAKKEGLSKKESFKNAVKSLIENVTLTHCVCANDLVAATLIEILEEKGERRPYIIGFDNSADSYRYVFDSFAFNVESMVKEALYHIISPSLYAAFRRQVQNPLGKVVEKE